MSVSNPHIIQKVFLEINTNSRAIAIDLKDNINVFLSEKIFPFIENYLASLQEGSNLDTIQFGRVNLSLTCDGSNTYREIESEVKKTFPEIIQKLLTGKTGDVVFKSESQNELNTFVYFLKEGQLPWNSSSKITVIDRAYMDRIVKNPSFNKLFKNILKSNTVQNRLVNQLDDENLTFLLLTIEHNIKPLISNKAFLENLTILSSNLRQIIWRLIISSIVSDEAIKLEKGLLNLRKDLRNSNLEKSKNKNTEVYTKEIKVISKLVKLSQSNDETKQEKLIENDKIKNKTNEYSNSKKEPELVKNQASNINLALKFDESDTTKLLTDNIKKSYYIENTGLILLHPYLRQFFLNCDILDKDNQIIKPDLAVHLLHYLATKEEKQMEYKLVFEKFICGIPIQQSISRNIIISENLKTQAEELLSSTIGNWGVFKNRSIELLRNEFLQRAGKLSLEKDNPRLIIERKTHDILLNKLPWTISICKLPWIDNIIYTDW